VVFIIAEAGVNHNGSIDLAKELVNKAKFCGCDAVKFQAWSAVNLASINASLTPYQKIECIEANQLEMLQKLELTDKDHKYLRQHCENVGIEYLCSPFDFDGIDLLASMNLPRVKIPSGEITNLPYLCKISNYKWKVILSTGMSWIPEIESALRILSDKNSVSLLHCTTEYPAPFSEVNLNCMKTMANYFNLPVGYSDHTEGIEVAIAAVALGAPIIEKHITLSQDMNGPDHKASTPPDEFKQMVDSIRNIEDAMGSSVKGLTESERKNITDVRKSIYTNQEIKKGQIITSDLITTRRPATGISPMKWDEVVGSIAIKDFSNGEQLVI